MKRTRGSALVDYVLPTAIVGLVLGITLHAMVQNNMIINFAGASGNIKIDMKNDIGVVGDKPVTNYGPYGIPIQSTQSMGAYNVNFLEDGSVSFFAGGQEVKLSEDVLNLHNLVEETTGSMGLEDLVNELGYFIELHAADYPPGEVPVEIMFGTSVRQQGSQTYEGTAEVNATGIKIGNDFLILQKDQDCMHGGTSCSGTYNLGNNRIEGSITGGSTFDCTSITGDGDILPADVGTLHNSLDTTSGISFSIQDSSIHWDLNFVDASKTFNL